MSEKVSKTKGFRLTAKSKVGMAKDLLIDALEMLEEERQQKKDIITKLENIKDGVEADLREAKHSFEVRAECIGKKLILILVIDLLKENKK